MPSPLGLLGGVDQLDRLAPLGDLALAGREDALLRHDRLLARGVGLGLRLRLGLGLLGHGDGAQLLGHLDQLAALDLQPLDVAFLVNSFLFQGALGGDAVASSHDLSRACCSLLNRSGTAGGLQHTTVRSRVDPLLVHGALGADAPSARSPGGPASAPARRRARSRRARAPARRAAWRAGSRLRAPARGGHIHSIAGRSR